MIRERKQANISYPGRNPETMKTVAAPPPLPSSFFSSYPHFSQLSFPTPRHSSSPFTCLSTVEDPGLPSDSLPFNGCKGCGKEEVESGCNGEGRIQGGIATIPGFGWWPIKAYRPCPGFLASGGSYRRRGQSLDEVAFGRGNYSDDPETRKKGKNRKQFKS